MKLILASIIIGLELYSVVSGFNCPELNIDFGGTGFVHFRENIASWNDCGKLHTSIVRVIFTPFSASSNVSCF